MRPATAAQPMPSADEIDFMDDNELRSVLTRAGLSTAGLDGAQLKNAALEAARRPQPIVRRRRLTLGVANFGNSPVPSTDEVDMMDATELQEVLMKCGMSADGLHTEEPAPPTRAAGHPDRAAGGGAAGGSGAPARPLTAVGAVALVHQAGAVAVRARARSPQAEG